MKIGILLTGRSPQEIEVKYGHYDKQFENLLSNRGFEFTTYPVLDNEFPESVNSEDGWLITGSKFGVYEDHDWIAPLEAFIRVSYDACVPMIGVCFGHQIIAQALGGTVTKFSQGWSVGVVDYELVDSNSSDRTKNAAAKNNNTPDNGQIKLIAWHQDQITKLPKDARVLAKSDFCEYAALAYKDRALTIQPHPEFSADYTKTLIDARRETLPSDIASSAQDTLTDNLSTRIIADQFETFFKHRLC